MDFKNSMYRFQNAHTNDVIIDTTPQGELKPLRGSHDPGQYWFILDFGSNGFKLMNSHHFGAVIADSLPSGGLIAFTGPDYPDQYWDISKIVDDHECGGDSFKFTNKSTGRVIAVNNGRLIAYDGPDFADQHWHLNA